MIGPMLYWLPNPETPGRLAISARPRGGDWLADEIAWWNQAKLNVVVSLLTTDEEVDLDLSLEVDECMAQGIDFVSLPIIDRGLPSNSATFSEIASELATRLTSGENIAIHCRQGIGRSALLAAAILMTLGNSADEAIRLVSIARGQRVPETQAQLEWLQNFEPQSLLPTGLS
jgi:protein-tyrosine phosphatase